MGKITHYKRSPMDSINFFGMATHYQEKLKDAGIPKSGSRTKAEEIWTKIEEEYGFEYMTECCGKEILKPAQGDLVRCPKCKKMSKVIKIKS